MIVALIVIIAVVVALATAVVLGRHVLDARKHHAQSIAWVNAVNAGDDPAWLR